LRNFRLLARLDDMESFAKIIRAGILCLVFLLGIVGPGSVAAQGQEELFRDFSARGLTTDETRFLQTALAFGGYYNGLLDGAWGPRSQRALNAYSQREFEMAPSDVHMATLALDLLGRIESEGWERRYFDALGMTILFPTKAVVSDPATEAFVNWRHRNSSLSYSVGLHDRQRAQSVHDYVADWNDVHEAPYTVRRHDFAVTSARNRSGGTLYARSNFVNGSWSTVLLSADRADQGLLSAVSASLAVGRAPPLRITEDGHLERTVLATLEMFEDMSDDDGTAAVSTPVPETGETGPARNGSGTGFFVSESGHVLTNAHVIDGCRDIRIGNEQAEVIARSDAFDLALVQATAAHAKSVAVFATGPARLNSDVTVAGYPYADILGGFNVTRGSVSGLKGLAGAETQFQITAPIQPGNSGGPVMGPRGNVVGVVVSRLDAIKIAEANGGIPQNVNFAVRGEIAKLFLSQHGIDPTLSANGEKLGPVTLAERAVEFTTLIECR